MNRIALCLAALLLASGAWGQSLSQQRHDDEIRRQQCESDGGTWGNAVKTGKPDKYGLVPVERSLGPCMMPQQEKKAPPVVPNYGTALGGGKFLPYTPFDLPPKEWDGPDEVAASCPPNEVGCLTMVWQKVHHRTCADPKRVLLMSEDGRWHCYDFSRMERQ